jgi:hypothetical protein
MSWEDFGALFFGILFAGAFMAYLVAMFWPYLRRKDRWP